MSQVRLIPLRDVLLLADAGTWGKEADSTSGVPVLRSTNIVESELRLDDVAWRALTRAHLVEKKLASGDILVTTSSGSPDHIGKCCIFDDPGTTHPYYFSNFMLRLRANPERANPRWLYHWLKSDRGRAALTAMNSTTSGLRNLNRALYLSQRVPLLPIADQGRIAAVLDKADEIRRKRQESLGLLDELLRSAFLEMFGDCVRNEKGWESTRLGTMAEIVSGVTKGRKLRGNPRSVPYLRVANVQDGHLDLREMKVIDANEQEISKYSLQPGDIVVTEGGDPDKLGRGAVWQGQVAECIHQNHVFRIRLADQRFTPEFVNALLGSAYGKRYFLKAAKQTTGIASINRTQLAAFPVQRPPMQLQQKYARLLAQVDSAKGKLGTAWGVSSKLVASLEHSLFSGKHVE